MKNICKCALHDYLSKCFAQAREDDRLPSAPFFEHFMTDTCPGSDSEHDSDLCCTLTFILYLCFFCKDVNALIQALRDILLGSQKDDRFVS